LGGGNEMAESDESEDREEPLQEARGKDQAKEIMVRGGKRKNGRRRKKEKKNPENARAYSGVVGKKETETHAGKRKRE